MAEAGVSRTTAHMWVGRFVAEGEADPADRSSRPRSAR
ncbi:leucine zipper domain-containing protein [Streptomyces sp. NPDC057565]